MMPIQPGQLIGESYRVERLLGSGGMADVYVVTHTRMPRQFALKIMRMTGDASGSFVERFNREAEILARLRHPHIVDVIDHNILPDGRPYLVMDLLEGEDLGSYLLAMGALPLRIALHLCHQIGDALTTAHAMGITHRDLKPSNIFLCKRGPFPNYVKILDFGIAKMSVLASENTPIKTNTTIAGTPGYMAPEQVYGQSAKLGPSADQFALAAILYEMLSGQAAFTSPTDTAYSAMARTVSEDPPELQVGLPQLREAIKRALSKEPADRFPSIQHFLAAIGATSFTVFQEPAISMHMTPSTMGDRHGEILRNFARKRVLWSAGIGGTSALAVSLAAIALSARVPARSVDVPPRAPIAVTGSAVAGVGQSAASAVAQTATTPSAGPTHIAEAQDPVADPAQPAMEDRPSSTDPIAAFGLSKTTESPRTERRGAGDAAPIKTAVAVRGNTNRRPSGSASRVYEVVGHHSPTQAFAIQTCLRTTLGDIGGLDGSSIRLERSGTLHTVEAPPSVRRNALDTCLEQALVGVPVKQLPQSVVIRILRGG